MWYQVVVVHHVHVHVYTLYNVKIHRSCTLYNVQIHNVYCNATCTCTSIIYMHLQILQYEHTCSVEGTVSTYQLDSYLSGIVHTGLTQLSGTVHTGLTQLSGTVHTGLTQLSGTVHTGLTQLSGTVHTGLTQLSGTVHTGLTQLSGTVHTGLTQLSGTVHTGLTQLDSTLVTLYSSSTTSLERPKSATLVVSSLSTRTLRAARSCRPGV